MVRLIVTPFVVYIGSEFDNMFMPICIYFLLANYYIDMEIIIIEISYCQYNTQSCKVQSSIVSIIRFIREMRNCVRKLVTIS